MSVVRVRGWSVRFRARALLVGIGCALAAGALGVLSIGGGDYPMSPADVLRTLAGGGTPAEDFIIGELRLPRLVTALLVGAALALGGAVFQALVRNPLGSPDILGVTQGAATGALLVVVVGGGTLALAGAAVAGGLATGVLLWAVAWARGAHGHRLILAGIGVAAILTGVNGWLLTRAQLMDAARAVLWLTGSLDGRGWAQAVPVAVTLAVAVPVVLFACGPALRMTELGDDTAAALGVPVRGLRTTLLVAAVLLVSVAASAAGPVNFVALTAPHLTRRLTRAPGPNLAAAMALGAAMLVAADLIAQRGFPGHQLPVGVVTGALGGGYLVWLLATERRAGRL
ncbi:MULTISPECIES: FecCD family ABC transporter permease [Micromonospora]|uniref:FecCD family ABC transporter permease n=1 Tax=Micromonospora TaxID=1873 RepID=UPI000945419C|nr:MULTISPECIES: iron chelate uptake ABC transporter family permease subunit [Micromonospora]MDG4819082.1 iron chelate uptake ABC transporter family permease subunit [Micromonospora sp. WMMD956]WFE55559.1 iron chelate uptake ABC transporter family permease subunit [Micromonospora sp. WMMD712]